MSAWFYMLRLKSGRLYAGATTDLDQRWRDHQGGKGGRTTALDPPVLFAYHEEFATFVEARQRETQVKQWSAAKKEALANGNVSLLRRLARSRNEDHHT